MSLEGNLRRYNLQGISSLGLFKLLNTIFCYSGSFSHSFWFIFILLYGF